MKILKKVQIDDNIYSKDFLKFLGFWDKRALLKVAKKLKGKKIIHINAVSTGGGVAELLESLIPYLNSLGIDSSWYAIDSLEAGRDFFRFTNKLHNALQGSSVEFTDEEWDLYKIFNRKMAAELVELDYDVLIANDPQALFTRKYVNGPGKEIYYSHIDTSTANENVWKEILPIMNLYEGMIFSNKDFVNKDLDSGKVNIFTPAIDPLSIKQKVVPREEAKKYLSQFGIKEDAPLIVQVSRFDIWKNPLGVVEAFRMVQSSCPDVQLALVGIKEAKDNPQADKVYQDVAYIAAGDPNISLFFNSLGIKDVAEFTMMMQNGADVVVQNSIKEGFGLTVTEAMWKEKPVVGGSALGIKKQIQDEENGFITKTSEELAERIIFLLKNPKVSAVMGKNAKESVRQNFLFPRLVLDHLKLYESILDL